MSTTQVVLRHAHILAGALTLLAGVLAMTVVKGSRIHRTVGTVFCASMLVLGTSGVAIALLTTRNMGNILGGVTASYLVLTGWATMRSVPGATTRWDALWALTGLILAAGAATFAYLAVTSPTGRFQAYPPAMYFIFAGVLLAATAMDVRMIARGGVTGAARTTRHLSRVSLAFFMATGSFFFGQPQFVPAFIRETGLRAVAGLFPLALLLFWLARIRLMPALRRR